MIGAAVQQSRLDPKQSSRRATLPWLASQDPGMDSDLEASDDSAEPGRRGEEDKELDREWNARKQNFWNVSMVL